MLGLKVPVMAFELIRLEKEHHKTLLFMGQGHTVRTQELHDPDDLPLRSTSFQTPLVWCGSVTSQNNTQRKQDAAQSESSEESRAQNEVTHDLNEDAEARDSLDVKYLKLQPQYAMLTDTQAASDAGTCSILAAHLLTWLLLARWLLHQ